MTAALDVAAPASHMDFAPGVKGAPFATGGVPGGPVVPAAGPPLPIDDEPPGKSRDGFAGIRYANAKPPAGYRLVDVHVARMGPDGRVRIDGDPDPAAPLRLRCPVLSCLQLRNNYPGHLCLQPDGSEVWRDWPPTAERSATC